MFPYWMLFAVLVLGTLTHRPNPAPAKPYGMLLAALLLIGVMVGLRYEVGADWTAYEWIFVEIGHRKFDDIIVRSETGFQLLNWLVNYADWRLWVVNLVCGFLFAIGLVIFARRQPDPWLVLVVAMAYLITVVAMGYTRQAVAIGIVLAGLADFQKRESALRFAFFVALAALFHRTAVFAYPLVAFSAPRNRLVNAAIGLAVGYALWDLFLADAMTDYVRNYVTAGYSSQGALIRVALSSMAAAIFLVWGKNLGFTPVERAMWRNFSFASLALLVLLAVSPSSTAIDRVALYVIPLQLAVLGRAPMLFRDWRAGRAAVVFFEGTVLFVWLNFAVHAQYWLPYQLYPL